MGPYAGMQSLHCVVPSSIDRPCPLLTANGPQEKTDGNSHVNTAIPNVCKHAPNKPGCYEPSS